MTTKEGKTEKLYKEEWSMLMGRIESTHELNRAFTKFAMLSPTPLSNGMIMAWIESRNLETELMVIRRKMAEHMDELGFTFHKEVEE